jgi:hypothetical protein
MEFMHLCRNLKKKEDLMALIKPSVRTNPANQRLLPRLSIKTKQTLIPTISSA